MSLENDLRILELDPGASEDDIRKAWRDLTKVWHPDRFGHDAQLRRKAEEKLKRINEAYQRLIAAGAGSRSRANHGTKSENDRRPRNEWRVRGNGKEVVAPDFPTLMMWAARGWVGPDDELFFPSENRWVRLRDVPEIDSIFTRKGRQGYINRAMIAFGIAMFFFLRKPGLSGFVTAVVVFLAVYWFTSSLGRAK